MAEKDRHAMDREHLRQKPYFDPIDLAFSDLMQRLDPCHDPCVALAAALVSRATRAGHVCLDLEQPALDGDIDSGPCPNLKEDAGAWRRRLSSSPTVGRPFDYCPMILDGSRLYMHRYWCYEQQLAAAIVGRCRAEIHLEGDVEQLVDTFFDDGDAQQRKAVRIALAKRFCVISGGPGTGKTHTLAKLIALKHRLPATVPPRIALAAPTGKAAARLQQSLESAFRTAGAGGHGPLPQPSTLHRLLGYQPTKGRFKYAADNLLPADMVIVDEASMVDLALMARLFQAVPPDATLVLTGDKDQLASVEAGAVLGDICHGMTASEKASSHSQTGRHQSDEGAETDLAAHIVVLDHNYRFGASGGIGALSRAINAGDPEQVLTLLDADPSGSIRLRPATDYNQTAVMLEQEAVAAYGPGLACPDPLELLDKLAGFRILTPFRNGPYGTRSLNQRVERALHRKGLIPPPAAHDRRWWYPGKPVMVTRNDYFNGLFNGDIGVAVTDDRQDGASAISIAFADGRGGMKRMTPHQLPEYDIVYAMTVHKSQGSEFDRVVLVLPDKDGPLLTRELLYTAVTRARKSVVIHGSADILARAVRRRIRRDSGLRGALRRQVREDPGR